jgi:hypothetical protein
MGEHFSKRPSRGENQFPETKNFRLERVMGIEPTSSAWKAEVLPLNYTRLQTDAQHLSNSQGDPRVMLVEGGGFEPPKAEPSDLQSDPFGRSGTPPTISFLKYLIDT